MKVKFLFWLLILFFLLPVLFGLIYLILNIQLIKITNDDIKVEKNIRVYDAKKDEVRNINLEDYILSVVAAEMPISFEFEALCAQAIAARSFAVSKMLSNIESRYDVTLDYNYDQAYISKEDLRNNWKENYEENYEKLEQVIKRTEGKILVYENEVVNAYFHSTSAGMTQNSGDVWTRDYPYLVPVISDESLSPKKKSTYIFSYEDILERFSLEDNKKNEENKENKNDKKELDIQILKKNNSGYVLELMINENKFTGAETRKILNLNSNSFDINVDKQNKKVIFYVYGFGHGIGMSQYGANKMAKDGVTYEDILLHYYTDTRIQSIEYIS